tara:strand:+ start:2485 stop:2928 length:444 start_codon:yes stop_codon:yes gene_type:complete
VAKYFSGKDGKLLIGTVEIAQLQSWSFSQSMSVLEITAMGDTDRTLKPGVRSYSGSARAYYYTPGPTEAPNVSALLTAAIKNSGTESDKVTLKLRLEEASDGTNARDIEFGVYITSVSMSSSVGEVSSVDFSWEADGAPTTGNTLTT